ncbi:MAG: VanZ family protein [Clostridia bacterium]|nr:VanZ family protein [Clostridia bacterium]
MISGTNPRLVFKRIIAYLFTLLVMTSIFVFSAQPAKESTKTSKAITRKIVDAVTKNKNISQKKKNELVKKWNNFMRKLAHFSLFLLLGISGFASASLTFIKKGKHYIQKNALYTFLFCVLYAISDEVHQIFVPGRSAQGSDLLIDSAGSAVGIIIIWFIFYLWARKKAVA